MYHLSVPDCEVRRISTEESAYSVALRPQGDVIAVRQSNGSRLSTVCLYKLGSGRKVHTFDQRSGPYHCQMAWSPNGQLLAFGVEDGIEVWDCKTLNEPKMLHTLKLRKQPSRGLIFAPHGETLLSYDNDDKLRLWDVQSGQLRGTIVFLTGDGWIAATAEGHYRASPGAEEKELFHIRTRSPEGKIRTIKPAKFRNLYNWVNDPDKPLKALR